MASIGPTVDMPAATAPAPAKLPHGIIIGGAEPEAYRREYLTLSSMKWAGTFAAIYWMFAYGSGWVEWSAFLFFYILNMLGITVGYHRLFSHRSFKTSQPMEYVFGIMAQMAAVGPVIKWAADHRRHHRYTDRPGDPHSPFYDGHGNAQSGWRAFYMSHFGWVLDDTSTDCEAYGKGLLDNPAAVFCSRTKWHWAIISLFVLPALWGLAFGGGWEQVVGTILIGGTLRSLFVLHAMLALNSVCHTFGYQNFKGPQNATNQWLLGIITLGEGWHNNHHQHANAAHVGIRWYEIDLTGMFIVALSKIGLVWDVQRVPDYNVDAQGNLVLAKKQST